MQNTSRTELTESQRISLDRATKDVSLAPGLQFELSVQCGDELVVAHIKGDYRGGYIHKIEIM